MRERVTECRGGLYRWEREFSNVVRLVETKNTFNLVVIDVLLDFDNVRVQMLDVFDVGKDECFFWVKAESNNVFYVVYSHRHCAFWTFELKLWSVNIFLIIGDLDNERNVESFLQVLGEDEWDSVT